MKKFNKFLYVLNNDSQEPSPSLLRTIGLAKNNQVDLTLLLVLPKLSIPYSLKTEGLNTVEIEQAILTQDVTCL